MNDDFRLLQEAARAGRYDALKHFHARAAERGFTLQQALQVLAQDDALVWHIRGGRYYWLVTEPLQPEPGQQLHLQVKLQKDCAWLITGWLADQRKTLHHFELKEAQRAG